MRRGPTPLPFSLLSPSTVVPVVPAAVSLSWLRLATLRLLSTRCSGGSGCGGPTGRLWPAQACGHHEPRPAASLSLGPALVPLPRPRQAGRPWTGRGGDQSHPLAPAVSPREEGGPVLGTSRPWEGYWGLPPKLVISGWCWGQVGGERQREVGLGSGGRCQGGGDQREGPGALTCPTGKSPGTRGDVQVLGHPSVGPGPSCPWGWGVTLWAHRPWCALEVDPVSCWALTGRSPGGCVGHTLGHPLPSGPGPDGFP